MRKLIIALLAFTTLGIFYACKTGAPADGINLKFNLAKGDHFDYSMDMDMHMKQNIMGTDMDVSSKMNMSYIFEAIDDSAGWKKMHATISRIAMNMDAGGMKINIDSDHPDTANSANPMGKIGQVFSAMKGGQFSFTINDKGEVGYVTGIQEMMQKALSSFNDPSITAGAMAGLSKSFNEEQFKQNLEQSFGIYPDKAIKPGDSWQKSMTINNNGIVMKADNTYTLESVENNNANIKIVSKISSGGDSTQMGGMKTKLDGTMNGNMRFDISTGMPMSGQTNMQMTMQVENQGNTVPINMTMTMQITGKKS